MNFKPVFSGILFFLSAGWQDAAYAVTPLRSAEQLAADNVLYEAAAKLIAPKVMECFKSPAVGDWQPFGVRFFLADAGKKPQQFEIVESDQTARIANSTIELAAVEAVANCAPYKIPAELRGWGGFWVTVKIELER